MTDHTPNGRWGIQQYYPEIKTWQSTTVGCGYDDEGIEERMGYLDAKFPGQFRRYER